ncbi:MAG: undecaprenyl-diphosphate phosphatase [Alphaproteobacteria bacterium]|nr:undecaprenyl-diphosphate phosphatase [Alphaproteobacteria bacterium]
MDPVTLAKAAFLGVIEGLTEFIPVSSTGHLILLVDLLGFKGPPGKVFEVAIQLGAILAICWVYRVKLIDTAIGMIQREREAWRFAINVLLAFLPAVVLGVLFHRIIKDVLFSPWVVCASLILGAFVIIVIERARPATVYRHVDEFPFWLSLAVGFCQALAMIPGVSRSGATIMGALVLGAGRRPATEFSFFLSIPTMLGATVYDLYKNRDSLNDSVLLVIAVGFVAAFFAGMLVVRWLVDFVGRRGFIPFAIYRIVLGVAMLAVLVLRAG